MVTIRIKGGLGNQLFQYAAGYALAKRMNQKLKLDSSFFPQQTLRGFKLGYLNVTFGDVVEHQSGLVKAYKNKYLNRHSGKPMCGLFRVESKQNICWKQGQILYRNSLLLVLPISIWMGTIRAKSILGNTKPI